MSLNGKEIAEMHQKYVMQSWAKSGADTLPIERAEGIYFYDYDGKKYADMSSLLVCSNLGHQLPEVSKIISRSCRGRYLRKSIFYKRWSRIKRKCFQNGTYGYGKN